MRRYCLAVDLKDDSKLISEYELWHKKVWPEIIEKWVLMEKIFQL